MGDDDEVESGQKFRLTKDGKVYFKGKKLEQLILINISPFMF